MSCNLPKIQAFPMGFRVSSQQPKCSNPFRTIKLQSFSHGVYPKPFLNPNCTRFVRLYIGFVLSNSQLGRVRCYSRKALPWLVGSKIEDSNGSEKVLVAKSGSKSSWEVSAEKLINRAVDVGENRKKPRVGRDDRVEKDDENEVINDYPRWDKVRTRIRPVVNAKTGYEKPDHQRWDRQENWKKPRVGRDDRVEKDDENEVINDPRWDKIRTRIRPVVNAKTGYEKPEHQRWDRQENWGRKTYREANESSVPKMVGEGVYGVGPVLAALLSRRREFYALYVQEGLELSKNNKKRKDKKGFEKVLKIADKICLSIKEVSKHDLNMVADNRPHQGLVLDASPLEMVNVKELDRISSEHDKGVLWVALDEVTDPQNLGAIIRSTYFFGASGVILCAKNSAPLSGVVSKASAGSLEVMEIRSCKNMMQFLTSSAENGWRVIGGSVSSRAIPLREVVVPGKPTILVLGSEGTGLRPLVERSCTQLVRIPGNVPVDISPARVDQDEEDFDTEDPSSGDEFRSFMAVESLNVSVAAGVLLHHLIGNNHDSGT